MSTSKPALTVDVVLLCWQKSQINVLLVKRKNDPFKGIWALPGGYVEKDEQAIDAAQRELAEETGYSIPTLAPIGIFDTPGRDPRGWCVSMAYWTILQNPKKGRPGSDAEEVEWFPISNLPELAFDHEEIITCTRDLIRSYAVSAGPLLEGIGEISVSNLKALLRNVG